jgi:peptidoglycan/xylan/chitin deacetylase (PgdA/CDA1 family)
MRPPYLATGGNVLPTMRNLGYRVITSDVDSEDWNGKTPQQSQQKFQQAGAGGNGHITLMHESTSLLFPLFSSLWSEDRDQTFCVQKEGEKLLMMYCFSSIRFYG